MIFFLPQNNFFSIVVSFETGAGSVPQKRQCQLWLSERLPAGHGHSRGKQFTVRNAPLVF